MVRTHLTLLVKQLLKGEAMTDVEREEQIRRLRRFLISYLKRFEYEFEFLNSVVSLNTHAFEDFSEALVKALEELAERTGETYTKFFDEDEVELTKMAGDDDGALTVVD